MVCGLENVFIFGGDPGKSVHVYPGGTHKESRNVQSRIPLSFTFIPLFE